MLIHLFAHSFAVA